jgi:uncharacterized protein YkwD
VLVNEKQVMRSAYFLILILLGGIGTSCSKEEVNDISALSVTALEVEAALEQRTVQLVNDFRSSKGLGTLEVNEDAYTMALEHTRKMAESGVMSHANFDARAKSLASKVGAVKVAENLSTNYDSAEETLEKWLESEGHHANITGDFTHTAVAVISTDNGDVYYTQVFYKKGN